MRRRVGEESARLPVGAALRRAALMGALCSGITLLSPGAGPYALAAPSSNARQAIDVSVRAVANITSLRAVSGTGGGQIQLTWTEPAQNGHTMPLAYAIRISSTGQISNNGDFNAAQPLSALSGTPVPAPGPGGGTATLLVTGLTPGVTYFFAVRESDNGLPKLQGAWIRNVGQGWNVFNSTTAGVAAGQPNAVTNLSALPGTGNGEVDLSWTAPGSPTGAPMDRYIVKANTVSIQSLGGDADAWFDLATSTVVVLGPVKSPGSLEALTLSGLAPGKQHFFAVKSVDILGRVSLIDVPAAGVTTQARAFPGPLNVPPLNVTAIAGSAAGSVDLSWAEPDSTNFAPPMSYLVAVSTVANMNNNGDFDAAPPLSAFSPSTPPTLGPGGSTVTFTVTGLDATTTYYFAVRVKESHIPPVTGDWARTPAVSSNNFTLPRFVPGDPDAITNLSALAGAAEGQVALSWTAPRNANFVPITGYDLRFSTLSVGELGGDATAWFGLAASSRAALVPAKTPGSLETFTLTGLEPGRLYFFGLKAADKSLAVSALDVKASSAPNQARASAKGVFGVTDLAAQTGSAAGSVDLAWTEPTRGGTSLPERYVLKMSSAANIASDAAFAAAQPLTSFSPSPLPAVGTGGAAKLFTVTGLTPFVTYYFALRAEDSGTLAGRWRRELDLGVNTTNFASARFTSNLPDRVTDLVAAQGTAEGEVELSWTAPRNQNFVPLASYEVRYASFSVAGLGGDTTAWFDLAASTVLAPAQSPGGRETLVIGGLFPVTTFFFAVKSADIASEVSPIDLRAEFGPQASSKPKNLAPSAPSGLFADSGLNRAKVSWLDLNAPQRGLDFSHFRLLRSTQAGAGFVQVTTTTALTVTDKPLTPFVTYFYKLSGVDQEGLESAFSSTASVVPFTLPPLEPFGLVVAPSSGTVNITWAPTTRFGNGEVFESTSTPSVDELLGYQMMRSTDACAGFSLLTVKGLAQTSHTDVTNGDAFFYQVRSFNSLGVSTGVWSFSSLGMHNLFVSDCVTKLALPQPMMDQLNAGMGLGPEPVQIMRRLRPEDTGGKVLQAAEFIPMVGGHTEAKGMAMPTPVPIVLHFVTQGGVPVPQAASYGAAEARGQEGTVKASAVEDIKNLGMFWNNGVEFKKLYGTVDAVAQTVRVETPNLGIFQIRSVFRDSAVTFDLSNITSRIFTPNNDGKNDLVIFLFDNPNRSAVEGKIYDLRGAYVATMSLGPQPDSLQWDGRMDGKTVTSGVYIYQLTAEGKTFNGTIVVAR